MDRPEPSAVHALAAAARNADGVQPLSEATLLSLHADASDSDLHGFVKGDGRLDGYAHLRLEDDGSAWAEVVVHPQARKKGTGGKFLEFVREQAPAARVWAHGDLPAAQATAKSMNMEPVRNLWMMSRSVDLGEPIADPVAPQGFSSRTFQPGDEQAWLDVNSRAFAHHPEQGRMTLDDLRARMAEPWFDPEGLFLVIDDASGRVAASHWTKIAEEGGPGEVYVVAVDPDFQGRGLGAFVTSLGLAHLRDKGVSSIDLYVEGDNDPAIATYRRKGFERSAHDVMYGWSQR